VPKDLTTKYRRIYATVSHTGGLTTILPVSTAARQSGGMSRNLQLSPETIFEILEKSVWT
jgi:hypothetical protein